MAGISFTEERLGTIPEGCSSLEGTQPLVSEALNLVLYGGYFPFVRPPDDPDAEPGPGGCVMANDYRSPPFKSVWPVGCSRDGTLWAYVGTEPEPRIRKFKGGKVTEEVSRVVVNGSVVGDMRSGAACWVSPAGNACAFEEAVPDPADPDGRFRHCRLVLGKKRGPAFSRTEKHSFSPRGALAYVGHTSDGEAHLMVDGSRIARTGGISSLTWSPDGNRLAYVVQGRGLYDQVLVVNGKKLASSERIDKIRFDAKGRRLAYVVAAEGGFRVVVDGKLGPLFPSFPHYLRFSGDSKKLIYVTSHRLAIDHQPGPAYDDLFEPLLSRNAKTVAFVARRGKDWMAVVNGVESEPGESVKIAVGELGGAACEVRRGRKYSLFHNGRRVRSGTGSLGPICLSADGKRLAFVEYRGGSKARVVVEGKAGETFEGIDDPRFAPDGRTIIYRAREGKDRFLVVGRCRYGPMLVFTPPVFDPSGRRFAVVAQVGREIWRKIFPVCG
jgi:dipeptidyl aminopeptidase/acylaminoacyl peptidase